MFGIGLVSVVARQLTTTWGCLVSFFQNGECFYLLDLNIMFSNKKLYESNMGFCERVSYQNNFSSVVVYIVSLIK